MNYESPVFINSLKLEKNQSFQRKMTNNHRLNYVKANISSIFDDPLKAERSMKRLLTSKVLEKEKTMMSSKFNTEKKVFNLKKSNYQKFTENSKPWPFKENKDPKLRLEKKLVEKKKIGSEFELKAKRVQTPVQRRIQDTFSNIFNEKDKTLENYETQVTHYSPVKRNRTINDGDSFIINDPLLSYKKKKVISQNFDIMESKQNNLKEKLKDRFLRAKNNVSSLHSTEFYQTTLQSQTKEKTIDDYYVRDVDYQKFNVEAFKSTYMKKGIHIYGITMYPDRNDKGKIEFKIRNNNDFDNFQQNLKEAHEDAINKFKVQPVKNDKAKKPRNFLQDEINKARQKTPKKEVVKQNGMKQSHTNSKIQRIEKPLQFNSDRKPLTSRFSSKKL